MLLTVDIGNTNIHFGLFKEEKLLKDFKLPMGLLNASRFKKTLKKNRIDYKRIDDVIISSVVPSATPIVKKSLRNLGIKRAFIVGKDIFVPIRCKYNKNQIGQDRLVDAIAAAKIYKPPLIVVDMGTAITFDYISKTACYEGGLIVPGVDISLDALYQKAALLPKVSLKDVKRTSLCPRDTVSSIKSGMLNGFGSLIDGVIERIKKRYGRTIKVVGTGGYIKLIRRYCHCLDFTDPYLTLKGLKFLYDLK